MTAITVLADPGTLESAQVMAALELDRPFDPAAFATFLGEQADLGTKWAPRFVRIVANMPLTSTNNPNATPPDKEADLAANPRWTPLLRRGAAVLAILIAAGNISIPVAVLAGLVR